MTTWAAAEARLTRPRSVTDAAWGGRGHGRRQARSVSVDEKNIAWLTAERTWSSL